MLTFVDHEPFVRELAAECYRAGARHVEINYADKWVQRAQIEHGPEDALGWSPPWQLERIRGLGERHGVVIPNQAAEHYYLITDTIPGLDPDGPIFEDPARYGYYREEGGGMMVGLFEPVAAPWHLDRIPEDFSFGTLPPDWDRMAPFLEKAMQRVPASVNAGVKLFF